MDKRRVAHHEAAHAVVAHRLGRKVEEVTVVANEEHLGSAGHSLAGDHPDFDGGSTLLDLICDFAAHPYLNFRPATIDPEHDQGEPTHPHPMDDRAKEGLAKVQEVLNNNELGGWMRQKLSEVMHESAIIIAMAGVAGESVLAGHRQANWHKGTWGDSEQIDKSLEMLSELDPYGKEDGGSSPYQSQEYKDYLWHRTLAVVRKEWDTIEKVAKELLEREELSGEEFREVVERSGNSIRDALGSGPGIGFDAGKISIPRVQDIQLPAGVAKLDD